MKSFGQIEMLCDVETRVFALPSRSFPKLSPQGGETMAEKNLMAFSDDTYDGHGGKAEAHHAEMEMIARRVYAEEREKDMQIIRAEMEERCSQAYRQAIKDLLHAV